MAITLDGNNGQPVSKLASPRARASCALAAAVCVLLTLSWLWSPSTIELPRLSHLKAHLDQAFTKPPIVCDPHSLPGAFHVLEGHKESPEKSLQSLWQPVQVAGTASGDASTLSSPKCAPQSFVQRLASGDAAYLQEHASNKTILLVGCSIDRNNLQQMCALLQGEMTLVDMNSPLWPQPNIQTDFPAWRPNGQSPHSYPRICHIRSIDLMLVNIFHFGLDEDGFFSTKDQYGPPYTTEERIKQIAMPLVEKIGRPVDIVEFGTGLWDLARFGRIDDETSEQAVRHLTQDRIDWYASRYSTVLSYLGNLFPSSNLYVRKLHMTGEDANTNFAQYWGGAGGKKTYFFPSWRIYELNQAIEAALAVPQNMRWHADRWGEMIFGKAVYWEGDVHPAPAASVMWLEQMLFRLINSK